MGYVIAYIISGAAADALGKISGRGVGRGSAMVVIAAGLLLAVTSTLILMSRNIRELENKED